MSKAETVKEASVDGTVWVRIGEGEELPSWTRFTRKRRGDALLEIGCEGASSRSITFAPAPEPAAEPQVGDVWTDDRGTEVTVTALGTLALYPGEPCSSCAAGKRVHVALKKANGGIDGNCKFTNYYKFVRRGSPAVLPVEDSLPKAPCEAENKTAPKEPRCESCQGPGPLGYKGMCWGCYVAKDKCDGFGMDCMVSATPRPSLPGTAPLINYESPLTGVYRYQRRPKR